MLVPVAFAVSLFAADVSSCVALPGIPSVAPALVCAGDNSYEQASTDRSTPENVEWFAELLDLNPRASVFTHGHGITVTNPDGKPLVLPKGPRPSDVTLSTPK